VEDRALIRRAVDEHDFSRVTGRERGVEDRSAFLRTGSSGDWRNYFSPESARFFDASPATYSSGWATSPTAIGSAGPRLPRARSSSR